MTPTVQLATRSLHIIGQTREEMRAFIDQMPPEDRAYVSPDWLRLLDASAPVDPWIHGFKIRTQLDGKVVGQCGFTGPPKDGVVEIGYAVAVEHQGKGYATEAAEALAKHAFESGVVRLVCAHTRPEPNASTRVLTKAGFRKVAEIIHPEDGLVWRWEKESFSEERD